MAVCEYTKGALDQVLLYPIDMGYGRPIPQRGRPVLSTREVGDETLKWLQKVSEPFGTEISIVDGVGVIRLKTDWDEEKIGSQLTYMDR